MSGPGRTLVLGVGNRDRGDDGVGPAVIDCLSSVSQPGVSIREAPADASTLMAAWEGATRVILIDACRSGAPAGAVRRIDVRSETLPPDPPGCSTHGFGLAAAIELARSLGTLPKEMVVYAVEAETLEPGAPLSRSVSGAIQDVARRVAAEVAAPT